MMEPDRARYILSRCNAFGSFHALDADTVNALLAEADHVKYRRPKNANGSRARYFHAYLNRCADSLTGFAREQVKKGGTCIAKRGRRRVTVSNP